MNMWRSGQTRLCRSLSRTERFRRSFCNNQWGVTGRFGYQGINDRAFSTGNHGSESYLGRNAAENDFDRFLENLTDRAPYLSLRKFVEAVDRLEMRLKNIDPCDYEGYHQSIQLLMNICSQFGNVQGAELTERLLMLTSNKGLSVAVNGPSKQMYTIAINAWTKIQTPYHGDLMPITRAQQILEFMMEEHEKSTAEFDEKNKSNVFIDSPKPDVVHYTTLLQGLANANSRQATVLATRVLFHVEQYSGILDALKKNDSDDLELADLDPNLVPDRQCYNTVLYCLSRYFLNHKDVRQGYRPDFIITRMKAMIQRMQRISSILNNDNYMPNTRSYNLLLQAFTRPRIRDTFDVIETEKILMKMFDQAENTLAMKGLTLDDLQDNSSIIEELQEHSVFPNIKSYNSIINAWSHNRSSHRLERVMEILRALITKPVADTKVPIDESITNHPLLQFIEPDSVTLNSTLTCVARSGPKDAGKRSEKILNALMGTGSPSVIGLKESRSSSRIYLSPDIISYNIVIKAYAECDDVSRAEELLDHLVKEGRANPSLKPDANSFNAVIQGWSNSSDVNCGEKAEAIFNRCIERFEETDYDALLPSASYYNYLVRAWCQQALNSGDELSYNKAIEVLNEMRNRGFSPTTDLHNKLLSIPHTISVKDGRDESRLKMARLGRAVLLAEVEKESDRTNLNIFSFNHVIKGFQGFSRARHRRECIFAIIDTFNVISNSQICKPNDQTFIQVFKGIQLSLDKDFNDRGRLCEDLFRECCESGQLTNATIRICQASNMLPKESILKLEACRSDSKSPCGPLTVYNLPFEWSSNRRSGQNQRYMNKKKY